MDSGCWGGCLFKQIKGNLQLYQIIGYQSIRYLRNHCQTSHFTEEKTDIQRDCFLQLFSSRKKTRTQVSTRSIIP